MNDIQLVKNFLTDLKFRGILTLVPDVGRLIKTHNGRVTRLSFPDLSKENWFVKREPQQDEIQDIILKIGRLSQLRHLELRNTNLTEIPEFVATLEHLRTFHFSGNIVKDIRANDLPPTIQKLVFINNDLDNYPGITHLTKLQSLSLAGNWIDYLEDLSHLPLQRLNLGWSHLTKLEINKLPKKGIVALNLSLGNYNQFPIELNEFTNLQRLILDGNRLKEQPDQIIDLPWVTRLSMVNCELHSVNFLSVPNLERISLGWNNIVEFPTFLQYCQKVTDIELQGNKIIHLPAWIADLKSLRYLDLDQNEVDSFPRISDFKSLEWVNLHYNPLANAKELSSFAQDHEITIDLSCNRYDNLD